MFFGINKWWGGVGRRGLGIQGREVYVLSRLGQWQWNFFIWRWVILRYSFFVYLEKKIYFLWG